MWETWDHWLSALCLVPALNAQMARVEPRGAQPRSMAQCVCMYYHHLCTEPHAVVPDHGESPGELAAAELCRPLKTQNLEP